MFQQSKIEKIQKIAKEFFAKMTVPILKMEADISFVEKNSVDYKEKNLEPREIINLNIILDEPQVLIGQGGQTLSEAQRILRMVLNKKLEGIFNLNLDINDYKKKKIEYLKTFARDLADDVALSKKERVLSPMPSYQRKIIHSELSNRADVTTESQGEGKDRCVVIKPCP